VRTCTCMVVAANRAMRSKWKTKTVHSSRHSPLGGGVCSSHRSLCWWDGVRLAGWQEDVAPPGCGSSDAAELRSLQQTNTAIVSPSQLPGEKTRRQHGKYNQHKNHRCTPVVARTTMTLAVADAAHVRATPSTMWQGQE
jgi:hypothetical protein